MNLKEKIEYKLALVRRFLTLDSVRFVPARPKYYEAKVDTYKEILELITKDEEISDYPRGR